MIFKPPYRWFYRPLYFFRNISHCWYDLINGFKNLVRWFPVIWFDRDWDWYHLAKIMETKFRFMKESSEHWNYVGCERATRQLLVCEQILKFLIEDDCKDYDYKKHEARMKFRQQMLGEIIGNHLREWWD